MKKIFLLSFVVSLIFVKCSNFDYKNLHPETKFSIPYSLDSKEDSIKIMKNSDYFYQIPDKFFIKKNYLYIIDKFNARILKINNENKFEQIIKLGQYDNENLHLYIDTNQNILYMPKRELEIVKNNISPGIIKVNNNDEIYLENQLLEKVDEGNNINNYSLVMKYNKIGNIDSIISLKTIKKKIFPFENLINFNLDRNNDLFIILKTETAWRVIKYNYSLNNIQYFNIDRFISKLKKVDNITATIDNIDFTADGKDLVIAVSFFKKDIIYNKTIFYKVFTDGSNKKLFEIKDEEFSFILVNNHDLIYLETSEPASNDMEKIVFRVLNMSGHTIINKLIKLDRKNKKWFNIFVQKDDKIFGINLDNNKYNIVEWK